MAEHERRRREAVVKLYDTWREVFDSKEGRATVLWYKHHTLSSQDADLLWQGKPFQDIKTIDEAQNLRYQTYKQLNFLEEIAVCYRDDVAQAKMVHDYFGKSCSLAWHSMATFATVEQTKVNDHAWRELKDVVEKRWDTQPNDPVKPITSSY